MTDAYRTIYFLKGLPASGKTTMAAKMLKDFPSLVRVNRDDIRVRLFGKNVEADKEAKRVVDSTEFAEVEDAVSRGKSVIVDSTNLPERRETKYRDLARKHQFSFSVVDFTNVPLRECLERNRTRGADRVPDKVIRRMWKDHLSAPQAQPPVDHALADCYLSDIDGTVAIHGSRSPYDYDRCEEDLPNVGLIRMLGTLRKGTAVFGRGPRIIMVSGRPDSHRKHTERWLKRHKVRYDELHMRRADDKRSDVDVKREIYENHILGRFNVLGVFDDRLRVQKLWWDLNLPLFGCQNPHDDNDF